MRTGSNILLFALFLAAAEAFGLNSYSVMDCVRTGLQNNRTLRETDMNARFRARELEEKVRGFFPRVGLSYDGGVSTVSGGADSRQDLFSVSFTQLLYDGGSLSESLLDNRLALELSFLDNNQKRLDFLVEVISGYIGIQKSAESLSIRRTLLTNQEREWRIAVKSLELGEATQLDVTEWEIALKQSRIDLMELEKGLRTDKAGYNRLLGLSLDTELDFSDRLNVSGPPELTVPSLAELTGRALAASLELKKMRLQLSRLQEESAWYRPFLPQVSLKASYSTSAARPFRPADTWNVGVDISLPLFTDTAGLGISMGGNNALSSKSGRSTVQTTVLENPAFFRVQDEKAWNLSVLQSSYRELIEDIRLKANNALENLGFQREKLRLLEDKIRLSEARLTVRQNQLRLGEIELSEFIRAQSELFSMRLEKVETLYIFITEYIQILKMQGLLDAGATERLFCGFLSQSSARE